MTSTNPFIDLSAESYFTTGWTYNVAVSIDGGITYGSTCQLITPHLTKLKTTNCNVQLDSWTIEANKLPFTNQYKFYFKRIDTGVEYWINKNIPQATLSDAGNYSGYFVPGKTYEVKVANPIHAYGTTCKITLPPSFKRDLELNEENCEDIILLYP